MLLELLVSTGIVIGILGAVFTLFGPFDGAVAVQSRAADLQQRQRTVLSRLHRDLLMAGSGPHSGDLASLAHLRPPVVPALGGMRSSRPVSDQVSVMFASGESMALLATPLSGRLRRVTVTPGPGCRWLPCGLSTEGGGLVLVFDEDGRSGLYRAVGLRGTVATLEFLGPTIPGAYPAGARLLAVSIHTYSTLR